MRPWGRPHTLRASPRAFWKWLHTRPRVYCKFRKMTISFGRGEMRVCVDLILSPSGQSSHSSGWSAPWKQEVEGRGPRSREVKDGLWVQQKEGGRSGAHIRAQESSPSTSLGSRGGSPRAVQTESLCVWPSEAPDDPRGHSGGGRTIRGGLST